MKNKIKHENKIEKRKISTFIRMKQNIILISIYQINSIFTIHTVRSKQNDVRLSG